MALSLSKRMFLAGSCLQINFIFGGYCVCSKGHGVCFLWSSECAPMCLIPTWAPLLVKGETIRQKWKSKCPLLSATNTHSDTSRIFFNFKSLIIWFIHMIYIYTCMYACIYGCFPYVYVLHHLYPGAHGGQQRVSDHPQMVVNYHACGY